MPENVTLDLAEVILRPYCERHGLEVTLDFEFRIPARQDAKSYSIYDLRGHRARYTYTLVALDVMGLVFRCQAVNGLQSAPSIFDMSEPDSIDALYAWLDLIVLPYYKRRKTETKQSPQIGFWQRLRKWLSI